MADICLSDYLASIGRRRWQPGTLDCAVFMADWVQRICGRDPIFDVRGSYSTERQFLRIIRGEGGFEKACAARLNAVGFRQTPDASHGDLLVVMAPYAVRRGQILRRPTGAICVATKLRAVVTSDIGLVIADEKRLPMIAAWTLRNG